MSERAQALARAAARRIGALQAPIWRLRFRLAVVLSPGHAVVHPSVRFQHAVRFQGAGRLVAARGVVFGYPLANAGSIPILLQPRMPEARIHLGAGTIVVNGAELIACRAITIGRDCRIGARALIVDSDFHGIAPDARGQPGLTAPVRIGRNVWIGTDATVLKGVTIGDDAVVAARCVVTRDVPAGGIAAGNPMRVVGSVYDR